MPEMAKFYLNRMKKGNAKGDERVTGEEEKNDHLVATK